MSVFTSSPPALAFCHHLFFDLCILKVHSMSNTASALLLLFKRQSVPSLTPSLIWSLDYLQEDVGVTSKRSGHRKHVPTYLRWTR